MNTLSKPAPNVAQTLAHLMTKAQEHPELNFLPLLKTATERSPEEWEDFLCDVMGLLGEFAANSSSACPPPAGDLGHTIWMLNRLRETFRDVRGGAKWD